MGDESIIVNFGRPMPVFPLPGFVLLPHAVQPLHIFEPRYRQMVKHSLAAMKSGGGQIAMATMTGIRGSSEPLIREVVCIGQIVQHKVAAGGRFNILLQGICRARILAIHEPDEDHLYRTVHVSPVEPPMSAPPLLTGVREALRSLIAGPHLRRLAAAEAVLEWIDRDDVPTHAVLEIVAFALVNDPDTRYSLLEDPSAESRAMTIRVVLRKLDRLVAAADRQHWRDWPKGLSWN